MTEDKDNGMTNSNGTPGGEGTAVTFALDEGYQFGLGVFETINLTGGRLVMLDRHLDRLRRGARALDIDAPDDDTLRAHIAEHLDAAESSRIGRTRMRIGRRTAVSGLAGAAPGATSVRRSRRTRR